MFGVCFIIILEGVQEDMFRIGKYLLLLVINFHYGPQLLKVALFADSRKEIIFKLGFRLSY